MAATDPTPRPCPFCGVAVAGPHEGCAGLFKEIMSAPPESALDEMPPEVLAVQADDTRRLNEYILVEQIGKGGMGTVWKAWDRKLTRWVAVKFLNGQDADDFARFSREAKLAARLRHPNIAAVFDTGEVPSKQAGQDSVRYLAMELIEGQSVATAELPLAKWLEAFARIARALDHAHRAGVIHRDIKPTNLMLTREHWPYVMDFGLAKSLKAGSSVSMSGVILGTPSFMPPEQAGGKTREIDERSDIYSLGASLYYVLTRQAPFNGEDSVDIIVKVLKTSPPRPRELCPEMPEPVEAVILKAMAREKEHRYATAGALAEDLEKLAAGGTPALQPRSKAPAVALILLSLGRIPLPLPSRARRRRSRRSTNGSRN
jgi:eukaryotic-like serine/threonine-protein kinase